MLKHLMTLRIFFIVRAAFGAFWSSSQIKIINWAGKAFILIMRAPLDAAASICLLRVKALIWNSIDRVLAA